MTRFKLNGLNLAGQVAAATAAATNAASAAATATANLLRAELATLRNAAADAAIDSQASAAAAAASAALAEDISNIEVPDALVATLLGDAGSVSYAADRAAAELEAISVSDSVTVKVPRPAPGNQRRPMQHAIPRETKWVDAHQFGFHFGTGLTFVTNGTGPGGGFFDGWSLPADVISLVTHNLRLPHWITYGSEATLVTTEDHPAGFARMILRRRAADAGGSIGDFYDYVVDVDIPSGAGKQVTFAFEDATKPLSFVGGDYVGGLGFYPQMLTATLVGRQGDQDTYAGPLLFAGIEFSRRIAPLNLLAAGDSLMASSNTDAVEATPEDVADALYVEGFIERPIVNNNAVPGSQIQQIDTAALIAQALGPIPGRAGDVALILSGTNDGYFGASAEVMFNRARDLGNTLQPAGIQVLICTVLPRSDALYAGTWDGSQAKREENRLRYNRMLRNGWGEFADGLVDIAADRRIGGPGASDDTTYFMADKVHLNAIGQAVIVNIMAAEIRRLMDRTS